MWRPISTNTLYLEGEIVEKMHITFSIIVKFIHACSGASPLAGVVVATGAGLGCSYTHGVIASESTRIQIVELPSELGSALTQLPLSAV